MPAPAPVKMTAPTPKKQPIPIWLKAVPLILIALALCSFGLWGLSTLASVMTAVKPTPMEKPLPVASVTQIFTPETPLTATLLAPTTRSITSTPAFTPAPTSLPVEISDSKGVSMRLVPAGDFTMGDKADDALVECQKFRSDCKREWFTDEEPAHTVFLDNFYMDVYEVTNAHYKACVDAGVCDTPANSNSNTHPSYYGNSAFDNYPVVSVDWFQSKTYCEWRKASLPTETEWEKAARGTDERTYPWGEGIDKDFANYVSNARDVIAIGSDESNKSPYGMYDMAGNALEWTADWYQAYPGNTVTDSINYGEKYRVLRGGSYGNYGYELRVSRRTRIIPDHSDYPIGFRCIATLK
jgi:formylglycine-generating enzyme required for sulfatase activity